jgi:hypothetical protein
MDTPHPRPLAVEDRLHHRARRDPRAPRARLTTPAATELQPTADADTRPAPHARTPAPTPPPKLGKAIGTAKWTWFYLYVILDVFSRFAARRKTAVLFPDPLCARG